MINLSTEARVINNGGNLTIETDLPQFHLQRGAVKEETTDELFIAIINHDNNTILLKEDAMILINQLIYFYNTVSDENIIEINNDKIQRRKEEFYKNRNNSNTEYIEPEGILYIIFDGSNYKIGIANDLNQRLRSLQTSSSKTLIVTYSQSIKHKNKLESYLHKKYRDNRLSGEWFNLSLEDIEDIKQTIQLYSETGELN